MHACVCVPLCVRCVIFFCVLCDLILGFSVKLMLFCQIDFYVFKRDAQISVLKLFLVLYIIQKGVPQSSAKECYIFFYYFKNSL